MENAVKRIGVLTSGGDAPGMNAAVRSVVRSALYRGIECIGIRRGYNGLITGDIVRLDEKGVAHIINRGGTILYTARSDEFRTLEGQKKAASVCKLLGLDGIVGIGGDGTFRGLVELSKQGISVVGVPATIDNDIVCTDYTLGFDTAANTAVEAIDRLRDTMQSHERCSVVEVMGRNAGHLALYTGLAAGASAVLLPERPVNFEKDVLEVIRRGCIRGRRHHIVVIAEGVGHATTYAKRIQDATGIEARVTVLGYIQRGGVPSARDRASAGLMGVHALDCLRRYDEAQAVVIQKGDIAHLPLHEANGMVRSLDETMSTICNRVDGSWYWDR